MTKREECIEAMARAIEQWEVAGAADSPNQPDELDVHPHDYTAAEIAFDACLKALMEPDTAMLAEFATTFGWAGHTPGGRENARFAIQAMLTTLQSPQ